MASNMPVLAYKNNINPVNHEKEMKRLYKKHGPKGVRAYVQAVDDFITKQKENGTPQRN